MVKIINKKKYNTETADLLAEWSDSFGWNDFRSVRERLYRKRTGEYFLYGDGGPMTRFAKTCGNERTGGEDIIPFTEDEARSWCEEHFDGDTYESIFGEVEE